MVESLATIDPGSAAIFALGLVFSVLSGVFASRGSQQKGIKRDDTPTTLSSRGVRVPLVLGKRRVGPIFCWAGDRKVNNKTASGKGVSPESTSKVYRESGMHVLATGPAVRLLEVYDSNGAFLPMELSVTTTQDGTVTDIEGRGSFSIYWGNYSQDKSDYLVAKTGVDTNWPGAFYVLWNRRKNGTSPRWDNIEYLIESYCIENELSSGSAYYLDDTESTGLNAAHALYQLFTAQHPHGAGMNADWIDKTSLEAMGVLMESEHLPINIILGGEDEGSFVRTAVSNILNDMGYALSLADGRLALLPIRAESPIPVIDETIWEEPPKVENIVGGRGPATRIVYEFDDELRGYRTSDIVVMQSGRAQATTAINDLRIDLSTVTHPAVAQRIADRRQQSDFGDRQAIELKVKRVASAFVPGQLVEVDGVGPVRIVEVEYLEDGSARLGGLLDIYSVPTGSGAFNPDAIPTGVDAEPDLLFTILEVPDELNTTGLPRLAIPRVRANDSIVGAALYVSVELGEYFQLGEQEAASIGGTTESAFSGSSGTQASGPYFEPMNDDIENVLNLMGSPSEWEAGRQLLLVLNEDDITIEVIFLEHVEVQTEAEWDASNAYTAGDDVEPTTPNGFRYRALGSGSSGATEPTWPLVVGATVVDSGVTWECHRLRYQLMNITRAQNGTTAAAHASGSRIIIADINELEQIGSVSIIDGAYVCVKTQPYTNAQIVALGDVTPVCQMIGVANIVTEVPDNLVDESANQIIAD